MPNIHEKIGMSKPGFSAFDLSHEKKLSCNMGELIPVYLEEVLPGDMFKVKTEIMLRMAPMTAPVMHRVNVYLHFFFVPNRLVWPGDESTASWQQFITGGRQGTSVPVFPTYTPSAGQSRWGKGSLADYFGLPIFEAGDAMTNPYKVSQLPFCGYNKIYYDYYRDPNLVPEAAGNWTASAGAPMISINLSIRKRAWEKDYFTSALPWPQRGAEVSVPVDFNYKLAEVSTSETGATLVDLDLYSNAGGFVAPGIGGATSLYVRNLEEDAVQVSINDLRTSSAIQRWLEKAARGGYRYVEQLLTHFGQRSSDARLQRAEYLGGGKQPIVISEVLNTSATETEPQGNMAGHGYSVGTTNTFRKKFEEHGYVFGIMSVLPRTAYQQGIHRHFTRTDKLDYYFPEFANLGEQEVLNREIYWDPVGVPAAQLTAFGYQQRYAEYKYGCSSVHGDMRDTLDFWHLGRIFDAQPVLNSAFVESDPSHRIFAVEDPTLDKLWIQIYNDVKARRPMPYFSNPSLR